MTALPNRQTFSQTFVSIVIPAYNEELRLPQFLKQVISFCRANFSQFEIFVIDDGSRDQTAGRVKELQKDCPQLQLMSLVRNRGKGYAVKYGLWRASGDVAVFLDADGSTLPDEILANLPLMEEGYDIVIGSRVLKSLHHNVSVRWYRKCIGQIFNNFVYWFLLGDIQDTQCGFKMFRRRIIRPLFARSYLEGFGFDMEILFLARKLGLRVKEVGVNWTHVSGSKVRILRDAFRLFVNIFQIRMWHGSKNALDGKFMTVSEIKHMYDVEQKHWWFVSKRKLIENLLHTGSGRGCYEILDAGCGTGGNLPTLSAFGRVSGCDVVAEALEYSALNKNHRNIQCHIENMAFQDKTFDLVTALDVIEHVEDPVAALKEFRRVLNDNGRLIITVPAFRFLWSRQDDALCHLRRYVRRDLRSQLQDAGFSVQRCSYFFCATFPVVVAVRKLRSLFPKNGKPVSDTATLPAGWINALLKTVFDWEARIAVRCGLPLGSTIFAVAVKSPASQPPDHFKSSETFLHEPKTSTI